MNENELTDADEREFRARMNGTKRKIVAVLEDDAQCDIDAGYLQTAQDYAIDVVADLLGDLMRPVMADPDNTPRLPAHCRAIVQRLNQIVFGPGDRADLADAAIGRAH